MCLASFALADFGGDFLYMRLGCLITRQQASSGKKIRNRFEHFSNRTRDLDDIRGAFTLGKVERHLQRSTLAMASQIVVIARRLCVPINANPLRLDWRMCHALRCSVMDLRASRLGFSLHDGLFMHEKQADFALRRTIKQRGGSEHFYNFTIMVLWTRS